MNKIPIKIDDNNSNTSSSFYSKIAYCLSFKNNNYIIRYEIRYELEGTDISFNIYRLTNIVENDNKVRILNWSLPTNVVQIDEHSLEHKDIIDNTNILYIQDELLNRLSNAFEQIESDTDGLIIDIVRELENEIEKYPEDVKIKTY